MSFPRSDRRRGARLALKGLAGVAILAALGAVAVLGAAEWRLHAPWPAPLAPLRIQPAAALATEGERAFHVFGCQGCHGQAGKVLFEARGVGRLVAPNAARRARGYSDAELVRLIRRGVRKDGSSLIAMPAEVLAGVSDQDLAGIIAYLRQAPVLADQAGSTRWGPLGYLALAMGKVPISAAGAPGIDPPRVRPDGRMGAYLVGTVCRHCHELEASHDDGWGMVAPPLRVVARSYRRSEFSRLLRTGEGLGGRQLGVMTTVARSDLSWMTDAEIESIRAYLLDGR